MAAPKRTKLEIKRDRHKIAELYIQGKYQSVIAEIIGLTQQQISYDLKAIQKEWIKNTTLSLDTYKSTELAKIDHLERTYWQAWDRSLNQFKSQIVKGRDITKDTNTGKPIAESIEKTNKIEDRNGDPKYLQGIQWCIDQRCKILGVYAEIKHKLSGTVTIDAILDGLPEDFSSAVRESLTKNIPDGDD